MLLLGKFWAIVFSILQDDWLANERNIQALLTELYLGRGRGGGMGGKTFRGADGGREDGQTGQGANGTV